ncbi:hypothetical protein tb265_25160 [Gemmatimonadetes bacterium T265]|nr:hypothetical protein tb265_25160 [Gemmatimonadetes bacterium T265]
MRDLERNAALVIGNIGSAEDVPALAFALVDDQPLVRSHATLALGRLVGLAAVKTLRNCWRVEPDVAVRATLEAARESLALPAS